LEEITALHGLMRQYYHALTARGDIWEKYTRTSLMLSFIMYGVHVVFLVRGFHRSGMYPLYW
jgi:hypothetical protein